MTKNKNLIIIISLLLVTCIIFTIIGYIQKNKTEKTNNETYQEVNNKKDDNKIQGFDNISIITYDDEEGKKSNDDFIAEYGIQMKGFSLLNKYKFNFDIIDNSDDIKIDSISGNKIIWHSGSLKNTITVKNAKEIKTARLQIYCGDYYNMYIYYINENGELFEKPSEECDSCDGEERKIADNFDSLASISGWSLYGEDTCGGNTIFAKDKNNKIYLAQTYTELSKINTDIISYTLTEDNDFPDDDFQNLYIVDESVKVKNYLSDNNGNKINARIVIVPEDSINVTPLKKNYNIYIIDENNIIYVFNNYIRSIKGQVYNDSKVKSFETIKNGLIITYENGKTETIKGIVWEKDEK